MVKVLAVASGGGHWVQLLRLKPAFDDLGIAYCSVQKDYREQVQGRRFYAIKDVSRRNPLSFSIVFLQLLFVFLRERPDVLVTTGSAPALIAVVIARFFRVKSLWIDSIANCEELSTSGRNAARWASKCISQWPEVARNNGLEYWGSVL